MANSLLDPHAPKRDDNHAAPHATAPHATPAATPISMAPLDAWHAPVPFSLDAADAVPHQNVSTPNVSTPNVSAKNASHAAKLRKSSTRSSRHAARNSHNAPGPPALKPLKHLVALQHDPIGWFTEMTRQYGDCVRIRLAHTNLFLVNHPDLVEEVMVKKPRFFSKGRVMRQMKRVIGEGLLTSENEFHMRQRRLSQPAFHRERVNSYGEMMIACALKTRSHWENQAPGAPVDVNAAMKHLTMAVVGKTMLSVDLEGESADLGDSMTDLMDAFNWLILPGFGLLEKMPLQKTIKFRAARARLNAMIYRLIHERRQENSDRGDLLSMLMMSHDEDGSQMSDLQVRDEAMTIFIAGHESQTNALNWTWYLLSQNPQAEAKMHAELDRVLDGRTPTAADYSELTYTKMVLQEALRLYAPVWTIGRRAIADVEIGGFQVPRGSALMMSPYLLGRDARFYDDPERFDPERWQPEEVAKRPKYAYFPFGAGPRLCIGEAFSWMEGVLLVATLAQKFRLKLVPNHPPVVPQPVVTVRPRHGLNMILERRD